MPSNLICTKCSGDKPENWICQCTIESTLEVQQLRECKTELLAALKAIVLSIDSGNEVIFARRIAANEIFDTTGETV
jgi:hypothetical protein